MKRLTPAAVTLMTVVIVSLLVTAYFAKVLLAEEPKARLFDAAQAPSATESRHRSTDAPKTPAVELREIPMALGTLDPGTQVTAALLGTGRVRVDSLQPETLLSERALIGRFVKQPIQAGTPSARANCISRASVPRSRSRRECERFRSHSRIVARSWAGCCGNENMSTSI
jgi:hypothetical protein